MRFIRPKKPLIFTAAIALAIPFFVPANLFAASELQPQQAAGPQAGGLQVQQTAPALPPINKSSGTEVYYPAPSTCGQSCAFNIAGQASTALGYYIQSAGTFTNPADRESAAKNIQSCLANVNSSDCKKDLLVKTIVQYNFARDVRKMVLENQTNKKNMESTNAPTDNKKLNNLYYQANDQWLKGRFRAPELDNVSEKQPYKIPIDQNFGLGRLPSQNGAGLSAEKEALGLYLNDYKQLVHAYSDLPKDSFTKATPFKEGDSSNTQVAILQTTKGSAIPVNDAVKEASVRSQMDHPNIRQAVNEYSTKVDHVNNLTTKWDDKTKTTTIDTAPLETRKTGIGEISLREGEDSREATTDDFKKIAETYNKQVDEVVKKNEAKAKITGEKIGQTSVVLDVNKFDQFLDEIWPPGIKR